MAQETNKQTGTGPESLRSGLVDDTGLLEALFPDPRIRPTGRWLRKMRQQRLMPCVRIGLRVVHYSAQPSAQDSRAHLGDRQRARCARRSYLNPGSNPAHPAHLAQCQPTRSRQFTRKMTMETDLALSPHPAAGTIDAIWTSGVMQCPGCSAIQPISETNRTRLGTRKM